MNTRTLPTCLAAASLMLILPLATQGIASAQGAGPHGPRYATVAASASPVAVAPGQSGKLIIRLAVAPGFHVNSAKPDDPSLIATSFAPNAVKGVHYGAPVYPAVSRVKIEASPKPIPAYIGSVAIIVPFTVAKSAHAGKLSVGGTLTYQGCNAVSCYPPKQDPIAAAVSVK